MVCVLLRMPIAGYNTPILASLEPDRVAERSLAAAYSKVWDVWLWATPLEMIIFYLNQYSPNGAKWLAKKGSTDVTRNAMAKDLIAGMTYL